MAMLAAGRRSLYRYAGDRVLDGYARHCGLPSGIGRLCLLDDQVLAKVVETVGIPAKSSVLDIGCGRGFLARWLLWNSLSCRYVGVESAASLAPGEGPKFDRVFALETTPRIISSTLAKCIAQNLAPGGQYVVTLASFDEPHAEKIARSSARLQRQGAGVRAIDLTQQVREFALTLYSAMLMGRWAPAVSGHVLNEAARMLHAVEFGSFNYTLLTGSV